MFLRFEVIKDLLKLFLGLSPFKEILDVEIEFSGLIGFITS